jgi:hypothetical protein
LLALVLGSIMVACCSCASSQESSALSGDSSTQATLAPDGTVYNKYNLHFISEKGRNKASYANWTQWPGHDMLPYNSKIRVRAFGSLIKLVDVSTDREIDMEFHSGRMGMGAREYIDLITSPTPVSYPDLSDVDRQGIQAGKALVGMSKQGVMIALGYPARHETPSTDQNRWVYWKGRHDRYAVEFDSNGKVASVQN